MPATDTEPGLLKVTGRYKNGEKFEDTFNTVVFAIGRDACTKNIGLEEVGTAVPTKQNNNRFLSFLQIGVKLNPKNGKVVHEEEKTNLPHVFAIGDVLDDKTTPDAIQAGKCLARR